LPRTTPTATPKTVLSDVTDGTWSINVPDAEHVVIALDNDAGTQYNAIVYDRVTPVDFA